MSNSERSSTDHQQDNTEYYCIPRKFIFDVPDNNGDSQKDDTKPKRALKKTIEAEKHLPFIFSFPDPVNYKEGYSLLVKQIVGVYNHARSLIVEEYFEEFNHIVKELKIEQPTDCLGMLKEIMNGCFEKLQRRKNDSEIDVSNPHKDYEELLQKAEAKIRILIRNEQIFRLNFDILSQKCEDADKAIQLANQDLENSKKLQEKLAKENADLVSKLLQKDEEIKKVYKERDSVEKRLKEAAANLNALDNLDQLTSRESKNIVPIWNQQILNVLAKENKHTPSEPSSRPPSNFDGKGLSGVRQHSNRMTPTDRVKIDKTNIPGNGSLLSTSSSNLNKGQVEKMRNSLIAEFKKHMNANLVANTNRPTLNASLDIMLNKSTEQSHSQERSSVSGTMLSAKKRTVQQMKMGQSQDQIRVKPPAKERKLVDCNEKEPSPYLSNKNALQKIMNSAHKYNTNSVRHTSTGRIRESPLMSRSRIVQTEQSPDNKSQESRIIYNYASNQSSDLAAASYSGNPKKKSVEPRENKSQSRGNAKTSVLIKNMIADHLNKKLGTKAV